MTITQGGVYLPGKGASLPVLEIRDPQIRDPDPRIFTGFQIRDPGSAIRAKNSADLQHWLEPTRISIFRLYARIWWILGRIQLVYSLVRTSVGDPDPDPQIRDPDPRIFTGIQIRKGSAIICHADLICGS